MTANDQTVVKRLTGLPGKQVQLAATFKQKQNEPTTIQLPDMAFVPDFHCIPFVFC
jgi:hypothetical protein